MFNSTALELAIEMALVYLLLSLFCTAINTPSCRFSTGTEGSGSSSPVSEQKDPTKG
jgi:hypothetical protein